MKLGPDLIRSDFRLVLNAVAGVAVRPVFEGCCHVGWFVWMEETRQLMVTSY